VIETVAKRESRRVGWQQPRTRLYDEESAYIEWRVLKSIVKQSGDYDDTHGQFSEMDTGVVEKSEPDGTLPYRARRLSHPQAIYRRRKTSLWIERTGLTLTRELPQLDETGTPIPNTFSILPATRH
jgi:hypothetical protein